MSDDLREKVAAALWAADYGGGYYDAANHESAEADFYREQADVVLAVVGAEVEALRAENKRLTRALEDARAAGGAYKRLRDAALARESALRAGVEALADRDKDGPLPRRHITADALRALLAESNG